MNLPPESTLEDVKVRIRESIRNPNVDNLEQVALKAFSLLHQASRGQL